MRFLLTRPMHDSKKLAEMLETRGHPAVIEPMMEIRFLPFNPPTDPASFQAVVFTSANGVRAFRHHFPDTNFAGLCGRPGHRNGSPPERFHRHHIRQPGCGKVGPFDSQRSRFG